MWIEARTTRSARRALLDSLGRGQDPDDALRELLGLDTAGIDAAVQREVEAHFPGA